MTGIQKADAGMRRQGVLLIVIGAFAGALLMAAVERYRTPLRDWLLSDPEQYAQRLRLVFHLAAGFLSAPLFGFALYLWFLGGKVLHAQQFPLPRQRVIRDTPILRGPAAQAQGRRLKILAVCLGMAGAALWVLFWRLAVVFGEHAI